MFDFSLAMEKMDRDTSFFFFLLLMSLLEDSIRIRAMRSAIKFQWNTQVLNYKRNKIEVLNMYNTAFLLKTYVLLFQTPSKRV